MNYAWEVVLRAMEQGLDPHGIQFHPELNGNPYREASFDELNLTELGDGSVGINPLYRFTHLFGVLFDINEDRYPQMRAMLFDVFMHYRSQLDLRQGLTKSEYYARAILRDLLTGAYGERAAEAVTLFSNAEAKSILYCMLTLIKGGGSIELFRHAVRTVYPKAMIYRNNDVFREVLIYLPRRKNEADEKKLDFLVSMFLDINYTAYAFWGRHFGVIDIEETLRFDEMLIF